MCNNPKKKTTKPTEPEPEEIEENGLEAETNIKKIVDDNLELILKSLNPERFDDRAEWLSLSGSIINEGLSLEIFDNFSKISKIIMIKIIKKFIKTLRKILIKTEKLKLISKVY